MARLQTAGNHAACIDLASKRLKNHPADGFSWYWLAVGLLSRKEFAKAADAARQASRLCPQDVRAFIAMGEASVASGDLVQALAAFQQAMPLANALQPEGRPSPLLVTLLHKIGDLLHALNRLTEAAQAYSEAVMLQPTSAQLAFNLGITLLALGQSAAAQLALEKALANGHPEAEACSAMGVTLMEQGEWRRAKVLLMRALDSEPHDRQVLNNLAIVCQHLGQLADAEALIRRRLKIDERNAAAWVNLGGILRDQKRIEEAFSAFETALQYSAEDFSALSCMGALCADTHSYRNAVRYLRRALEQPPSVHPQYVGTLITLGNVLAIMGEHRESESLFKKALQLQPNAKQVWTNWFFVLNNHPEKRPEEIFLHYKAFDTKFNASAESNVCPQIANRRIHVGYVSADFTRHSVQNFLAPLLSRHDRSAFQVSAFANMAGPEQVGGGYLRLVENWHFIKGLTDLEVANLVREKQVDILVDLSGHTGGNRLDVFALRPAPVSVSWMGFGSTTGLRAIDYYLADDHAIPKDDEPFFSEQPWRLDRPYLAYRPRDPMGEVGELPALSAGRITFASLSRSIRFNDSLFAAWADILEKTPGSVLLLNSTNMADADLGREIQQRLAHMGIDPARVDCGFESPPWDLLRRIDISLDCFPHNSGTTLFESLHMGVPYITLSDRPGVGRLGSAILHGLNRPEWVAYTVDEYVTKAVALASDLPALARTRASLRNELQNSPLMDEPGFARSVEAAYVKMLKQSRHAQSPE